VIASLAVGMRPVVVLSGSMRPAISPGDILIERKVDPRQLQTGDVITFTEPSGQHRTITHRVRTITPGPDGTTIVTKGDMNNTVERFRVPAGARVGEPELRIPLLGYATTFAHTRTGLIVAIFGPLLVLALLELRDIWGPLRPPRLRLPHSGRPAHGVHP
jgi:signal peptidase